MSPLTRFLLLLLAAGAFAAKPLSHQICGASCYYSLLKVNFTAPEATGYAACTNALRVDSTFYCMAIHCDEADIAPGINWWASNCKKSGKIITETKYRAAVANVTHEFLAKLPTVDNKHKGLLNKTTVPSAANWDYVYTSVYLYDHMRWYANALRFIPYGFWAIVLLVGMGNNVSQLLNRKRSSVVKGKKEPTALGKLLSWPKRKLIMSPTFKYHHHQPLGWFTVPLRLQSIVIASYVIIHIACCAPYYPILDKSYYYPNRQSQVLRYFGDRLAALISSTLPLLFLFGGRGNIFIVLTGWSYRTFNIFHRWIGIILLIESIIHGAVFSAYYVHSQNWAAYQDKLQTDLVTRYGIMAGCALGIMVGFASHPVRKRMYEVFKAGHIVFAAILLAAIYQHIQSQFSGIYKVWIWMTIGIWSGDHVLRLLRSLVMNYKVFLGQGTKALASYSEETGMIRLQVYPSVMPSHQTPGVHYYLYFPTWRFWESHPFSLAGRSTEVTETTSPVTSEPKNVQANAVTEVSGDGKPYLTFMIRPRNGMTRRLRDSLRGQESSGQRRVRVLLDGPYGSAAHLGRFNDIIFIAGGSGITAVLPYIRKLFEDTAHGESAPNVKLVWAVKDEGFARDVFANDLQHTHASALAETKLREEIYVTSGAGATESEGSGSEKSPIAPRDSRFKYARPDMDALVGDFISSAEGKVAIFVCGPAKMADDARVVVLNRVNKTGEEIELFEEMYGW